MFPNLKAEMARRNISINEISNVLGVSEKTVRNYLNGKSKISWFDVIKIQNSFFPELKVGYLFDINLKDRSFNN